MTDKPASGVHIGLRVSGKTSGGGRVFASKLVQALVRSPTCSGVTVFVLGEHDDLDLPAGAEIVSIETATSAMRRRFAAGAAIRAAALGRQLDVLICPGTELSKVEGVPSVLWPLTVAPFEPQTLAVMGGSATGWLRWHVLRELVRRACTRADGLVYSSHYARVLHEAATPTLRTTPSTVIWPAPSLPPTGPREAASSELPEPYILFVSHLYPYKMVVELIRGFAMFVENTGVSHHLVIAGNPVDQRYARKVSETIVQTEMSERVHLLGHVGSGELPPLYQNAESFVFPSLSENASSYALIDALVYGKPVISSLLSSMPEICQDAPRYVDPRDPEHIAAGLAEVSCDAGLRRELARRSLARAEQLPSWDDIAERLCAFVTSLRDGSHASRVANMMGDIS